jgi:hypothetical protein
MGGPALRSVQIGPLNREHGYRRRDSRTRHVLCQHLTECAIGEGFDYLTNDAVRFWVQPCISLATQNDNMMTTSRI